MEISSLARDRSKLIGLSGFFYENGGPNLAAISFAFAGGKEIFLCVDSDTDSLFWKNSNPSEFGKAPLDEQFPKVQKAYGLYLAWAWEMINHQGYFDAVQIELTDSALGGAIVLQFKSEASAIKIFEVLPCV